MRPRPGECEGGRWQKSGLVVGEENSGKLRGPPGRGERKEAWSWRGVSALKGREAVVAWARGKRQRAGQIKRPTVPGIRSGREALSPLLNCDEGGRWRIMGSGVGGRARPAFQPSTPKGAYGQTATHTCHVAAPYGGEPHLLPSCIRQSLCSPLSAIFLPAAERWPWWVRVDRRDRQAEQGRAPGIRRAVAGPRARLYKGRARARAAPGDQ